MYLKYVELFLFDGMSLLLIIVFWFLYLAQARRLRHRGVILKSFSMIMNKTFITVALLIFNFSAMATNGFKISNGTYLKFSKDIYGWKTIIGPDVIVIKDKKVRLVYFHIKETLEYNLNEMNYLEAKDNLNSQLLYDESNNLKFIMDNYEFRYAEVTSISKLDKNKVSNMLTGKWKISTESKFVNFSERKDDNTSEFFLFLDSPEREGRYFLFEISGVVFLKWRYVDQAQSEVFVLSKVNENDIKSYRLDDKGLIRVVSFKR